jgi:16S rRNA (adenine1518-N6/adenine1519-N6)-dimethyltransferase
MHGDGVLFESLTFTVQEEVAQRLVAREGRHCGPISIITTLLGSAKLGAFVPKTAFWPAPKVGSRIVRIDFNAQQASQIQDIHLLRRILEMAFTQRRKNIHSTARARGAPVNHDQFAAALEFANVDPTRRADQIAPEEYLRIVQALS